MPLSPQQHRPALHANAVNRRLASACQNLTPSTPAPTPKPSKTATEPAIPTPPASTFAVNPSGRYRTNLNKSEQT